MRPWIQTNGWVKISHGARWGGIEPPTRGFSVRCSTLAELTDHRQIERLTNCSVKSGGQCSPRVRYEIRLYSLLELSHRVTSTRLATRTLGRGDGPPWIQRCPIYCGQIMVKSPSEKHGSRIRGGRSEHGAYTEGGTGIVESPFNPHEQPSPIVHQHHATVRPDFWEASLAGVGRRTGSLTITR